MADNFPNILETDVFAALRAFILTLVGCEVIRLPVNRTAMPLGDFIALSPKSSRPLSTNTDTYSATSETVLRPLEITIQVDCYGASACDRANTIAALFRDDIAFESLASSGFDISPLYASDATQLPLISGEDQYIERWTFDFVLQANPVVTVATQTANALAINQIVSVDRTYPA